MLHYISSINIIMQTHFQIMLFNNKKLTWSKHISNNILYIVMCLVILLSRIQVIHSYFIYPLYNSEHFEWIIIVAPCKLHFSTPLHTVSYLVGLKSHWFLEQPIGNIPLLSEQRIQRHNSYVLGSGIPHYLWYRATRTSRRHSLFSLRKYKTGVWLLCH